jgi:hypothetical protein
MAWPERIFNLQRGFGDLLVRGLLHDRVWTRSVTRVIKCGVNGEVTAGGDLPVRVWDASSNAKAREGSEQCEPVGSQ